VLPVVTLAAVRAANRARRRRIGERLWAEATRAAGLDNELNGQRTGT
jgi:hypothetical protein